MSLIWFCFLLLSSLSNGPLLVFFLQLKRRRATNSTKINSSRSIGRNWLVVGWWMSWLNKAALFFWFIVGYEPEAPLPQHHSIPIDSINFHSSCFGRSSFIEERRRVRVDWRNKRRMKVEWKVGWWNGEWGGKHITFYPVIKRKLVFFYGGSHSQLISSTHFIPQNKKINLLFLLHSIQLIY